MTETLLVVTCHPDGGVETLLKDQVFDTRDVFGVSQRKIERISEIVPTDDGMRFQVRWLKGPDAGLVEDDTFETYEEAVAFEVEAVNHLRLCGNSFA